MKHAIRTLSSVLAFVAKKICRFDLKRPLFRAGVFHLELLQHKAFSFPFSQTPVWPRHLERDALDPGA